VRLEHEDAEEEEELMDIKESTNFMDYSKIRKEQ